MLPIARLDLSDRKEMVESLLGWLTPGEQKAWLDWCCRQLDSKYRGTRIEGAIVGGKAETWHLFCLLCTQYGLDFERARVELERRVKQARPASGKPRTVSLIGLGEITWPHS